MKGKMREAILHYETALMSHEQTQNPENNGTPISKVYAETFMKLYNTKMACCDWKDYSKFVEHLKAIVIKQFTLGEVPCVDPFSLFMIDFTMKDKLLISQKWAENEKQKAFEQVRQQGVHYF